MFARPQLTHEAQSVTTELLLSPTTSQATSTLVQPSARVSWPINSLLGLG
jgi:hypothetical protein